MASFQIDGLASGLQTGSIIEKLLSLERQPVSRLSAKITVLDQRKQALSELRTKLATLQARVSDLLKSSSLSAKSSTVTKADGSASGAVGVVAGGAAANGSFTVTVSQLATATTALSTGKVGQGVSAAALLQSAGLAVPLTTKEATGTSGTFTINGTSLSVDYATESLNAIVTKINANVAGVTATIVNASGAADPAGNYLKLSSASAMTIGSGADTSNFLSAMSLLGARKAGATVTGAAVTAGALASTAIHLDGVIVTTRATAAGNTAAQNAASLAADLNGTAGITVEATANTNGTITLVSKARGVNSSINITQGGTGTGFSAGTTTQTTDEIRSAVGIGGTQVDVALTSARLATALSGLDAGGNGSFKINGTSISFNQNESFNAVISRINSSGAGVLAVYDRVEDKVLLTAKATGSVSIALQDVTGNFLAATGVLPAGQTLGQNAVYSISSVNGGASQSSASNIVTGIVPGVEITLAQLTAAPVTVSISQDTATTVKAVKDVIAGYNSAMALLRQKVKVDPKGKDTGLLSYDTGIRMLEASIRRYLVAPALGVTGKYQGLSDVGVTFGAIGSAIGATSDLVLDEAKLVAALQDSPQAVQALLAGFQNSAALQGGGSGAVASVTGAPSAHHEAGSYVVTTTVTGSISAVFTPTAGVAGPAKFGGTLVAGGTDTLAIPGMTITATNPLVDGTNTVTVSVQQKGILVGLSDYLKGVADVGGLLDGRQNTATTESRAITEQVRRLEARIEERRTRLNAEFSRLESLMSQLSSQQQSLGLQLANLIR